MEGYNETTYGQRVAGVYDEWYAELDEASIDLLAELAEGGMALELGIGTGRVALPLGQRGVDVHGVDASEAMVEKLRSKPGGDEISVTLGDFGGVPVEAQFDLIYVVFNTFFALLSQEAQITCFVNVASHLKADGAFLMEVFVPDLSRFRDRQTVRGERLTDDAVKLEVSRLDPVAQVVESRHVLLSEEGVRLYPVKLRYAWPSELDLMARLAGMQLKDRWGGWRRETYGADSTRHISVYALG